MHIDQKGKFNMDTIENMGDAHEALEECHALVWHLAKGKKKRINKALKHLGYPTLLKADDYE